MTTVIHIKDSKGTPNEQYIGRAGHGQDGYFGNPIKRGEQCPVCLEIHQKPAETIPCFEKYFVKRLLTDSEFRRRVVALRGKTLVCFCKPNPCHGDIIVSYIDKIGTKLFPSH